MGLKIRVHFIVISQVTRGNRITVYQHTGIDNSVAVPAVRIRILAAIKAPDPNHQICQLSGMNPGDNILHNITSLGEITVSVVDPYPDHCCD